MAHAMQWRGPLRSRNARRKVQRGDATQQDRALSGARSRIVHLKVA
jgi:hypothetical protein